jgi:hypothetical protein
MPLDRARIPGQRHPGFDCLVILVEPCREASHGVHSTCGSALQPGIAVFRLPLTDEVRLATRRSTSQVARRGVKGWHAGSATAGRGWRA